jgi:hypothetical protein
LCVLSNVSQVSTDDLILASYDDKFLFRHAFQFSRQYQSVSIARAQQLS